MTLERKINTGIITQVRMNSSRLPGKVLKEIKDKSILDYHIDRLKKTDLDIVIATTTNKSDDQILDFATERKIKIYRGSEDNVLKRFYEAAVKYKFDNIIRVTSDCPFIDSELINENVGKYIQLNNPNLYMSNVLERTYARGFDFEIFTFQSLKDAFENAKLNSDLEHVTPYIWQNKSGKTEFYNIKQNRDNSRLRLTVDTAEDFELVKRLIEDYNASKLSYLEIENLLIDHPELVSINAHIAQKGI